MRFDDRLRASMRAADSTFPGTPLRWTATVERAHRGLRLLVIKIAAGLAIAGAAAVVAVVLLTDSDPPLSLPPAEAPTPSPSPVAVCSASEETVAIVDQPRLPPAVAETRERIIELALRCDYRGLQRLADPDEFTFSFGIDRSPARFWRRLERQGEPVMLDLVRVLNLRPHRFAEFEMYGWPRVVRAHPSDEDWRAVVEAGLLTRKQADELREFEVGYLDRRAFITFDGRWTTYVAGD